MLVMELALEEAGLLLLRPLSAVAYDFLMMGFVLESEIHSPLSLELLELGWSLEEVEDRLRGPAGWVRGFTSVFLLSTLSLWENILFIFKVRLE